MGVFKKGKNNSNLDRKIARLDEDLKKTGVVRESNITSVSENDKIKDVQMITEHVKSDWRSGYKKEEISKEDILQEEINAVRNKKNSLRKVDGYIASINENYTQLKKDIFQELSQDLLHNIPSLENKINRVLEIYDVVQEGLLNQPPETQTQDPLTPLDQQFVTANDLDAHYKLFINRIQEQIATIGGGGEVRLKWLDDIVGIATNASAYDGQFLKYDHSIEKFVFETVSGVGTGSQGIQGTQGIQGIQGPSGVGGGGTGYFEQTAAGIHTTSSVGIGTTADSAYSLLVEGDARITGILTVGPASVTIDGINNEVTVGNGVTIYGNTGIISATSIYAAGSLLTGAQGTQGVQGTTGGQGTQGIQGTVGSFGGATFDYTFDSGISTADPGTGRLKFNYVGLSTVTEMYIDDEDDNGTDIQSFMRTIDDSDSTIKGHFKVSNKINADDFALFTIASLTEETGYFTVNCAYVSGAATSFTNDEDVLITFARTGDKGDTGTQGTQGVQGVQGVTGSGTQGATGIQGTQGINGPQGRQGIQGIQGSGGTQGTQGRQGIQGTTGFQGTTGSGTQGTQGTQGEQGIQGVTGGDGTQGTQGTTGEQGTQGITGDTGAQGTSGSAVAQGYQGIQGIPGQGVQGTDGTAAFQGYQGIQGTTGEQGVQGIQGDASSVQGYQGIQGEQGIQGLTGAGEQGIQGAQGIIGSTGGPGSQGLQGEQGIQGLQGEQGIQGQEGLPGDQGIQGIVGSQGTTGTQGAGGTQGTDGAQGTTGSQGTTGDQGIQGITGEQGIQGIQGEGVQGIQGTDGAAAAQGYQGTQGLPGDQGIQGLQGIAGEAAAQGFQGIQGSNGTQGTDGTQGAQGITGEQGIQGIQGIQGVIGSQGTTGTQGTDGTQGIQGITGTGTQGIQGILGAQGTSGEAAAQGIQGIQGPAGNGGGGGAGYWEQTEVGINTISNVGIATTNPLTPLQIEEVFGIKTGIGTFDAVVGVAADLDSFDTSSLNFQTAEYTINVGFGTYIQSQKVLVMQNGTTAYSQEYAVMYNPDLVVSIGATMTGTTCKLQATPETGITGLTTYRFVRTTLL